jgi:hypothetical protein
LEKDKKGRNRLLAADEGSPIRGRSNRIFGDQAKHNISGESTKKILAEDRVRKIVVTAGKENPVSLKRRKISDRIEQLYPAKSRERSDGRLQEAAEKKERALPSVKGPNNIIFTGLRDGTPKTTKVENNLRAKPSKVADMKKIFDSSNALEARPPMDRLPLFRPVFSDIAASAKYEKSTAGLPLPPPPVPEPLPRVEPKRSLAVSPKSTKENISTVTEAIQPTPVNTGPFQPIYSRKKQSRPKSQIIGEKIKLFESIRQNKQTAEPQKVKSSFTRKTRSSMQGFFEAQSNSVLDKEQSIRRVRGITGRDIKDIADEIEIEKIPTGAKVGKRSIVGGRRNAVPRVAPRSGGDGTMSDTIGSPGVEAAKQMVIKEAECRLKQPKPLRVVEMKRMMALCRERVGGMTERENGRVQMRKL